MELQKIANYLRHQVLRICEKSKNGHVGGCLGAVELFTALYFGNLLRFNPNNPYDTNRDFVLVRGHLGPLRYAIFNLFGWLTDEELDNYRSFNNRLPGHEDHLVTPGVDMSPSGSLGMILSYATGAAIEAQRQKIDKRFFVFLGDGEEQEGNISEAARHIGHLKLDNIIVVIDKNGKQLSDPTDYVDSSSDLQKIWEGYGWNVLEIQDGHSLNEIQKKFTMAIQMVKEKPTIVIANTSKGYGIPEYSSHYSGYHTYSTVPDGLIHSLLQNKENLVSKEEVRTCVQSNTITTCGNSIAYVSDTISDNPSIVIDTKTPNNPDSCQLSYFMKLANVWDKQVPLYFLTADTTQAPFVDAMRLREYAQYYNTGIREQHTVGLAHGISILNPEAKILFNTLDAFVFRWIDQLHALVQGKGNLIIIGDCSGLTNAKNGKTHQAAYQPASIRAIEKITFLEAWDAEDMFECLNYAFANESSITYIRSHRHDVDVKRTMNRPLGICNHIVHTDEQYNIVLVASGITVGECIKAAKILQNDGFGVCVVNIIHHNKISEILGLLADVPILTVYNGVKEVLQGPLAMAAMEDSPYRSSQILGLGFTEGLTGSTAELLQYYGLDSVGIYRKAYEILNAKKPLK